MSIHSAVKQLQDALTSAKEELVTAEKLVVHHTGEVSQLTASMDALRKILPAEAFEFDASKKPTGHRNRNAAKPKGAARAHNNMPVTDETFWLGLFEAGKEMKTGDIIAAAATKASIQMNDAERIAVLKQRMPGYLVKLTESKTITAKGDRNKRTYQLSA